MTALTINSTPLKNGVNKRQLYVTVLVPATPTQASNTIIYDPTTTPWTTSGAYVGTKIRGVRAMTSVQGTAGTQAAIYLTWDASTPVVAVAIPCNNEICYDSQVNNELFTPLTNLGGTGVTGKIGITTAGLVAGDAITLVLDLLNE
jgi:hypothetical protein